QRLSRIVGKSRAIELMATGRLMEFEEAASLGLVNQVLEAPSAEAFKSKVLEWARQFATPGKAAMAVGHIKRAVQSGFEVPLEYGLALERELQAKLFSSADAKEGLTAYTQKRTPKFQGK
ncbi:MAG: enoyl-CoA hydratase/isomerase family protein, partial [Planctomycetota bacterium]